MCATAAEVTASIRDIGSGIDFDHERALGWPQRSGARLRMPTL
jgi:hypothetical protein